MSGSGSLFSTHARGRRVVAVALLACAGLLGVDGLAASPALAADLTVSDRPAPQPPFSAPATGADESEVLERPDITSAGALARARGARVEVTGERTPTSSTFVKPDGTMTLETSSDLRNYAGGQDGALVPIDTSVTSRPDGDLTAATHPLEPRFDQTATSEALTVSTQAGELSLGLAADTPVPDQPAVEVSETAKAEISGNTAVTYSEVLPGVDLNYEVQPSAVKETLVLDSAAAGSSFAFDVKSPGATASVTTSGAVVFRKKAAPNAGAVVATIPVGLAWDSATGPAGAAQSPVTTQLTPAAGQPAGTTRVTVSVDDAWLNAPERVFPLFVDPTVSLPMTGVVVYRSDGLTCTQAQGCPVIAGNLRENNTDVYTRSQVGFDYTSLIGKNILNSRVDFSVFTAPAGDVCRNSSLYLPTAATYAGSNGTLLASTQPGIGICGVNQYSYFSGAALTSQIQSWATTGTLGKKFAVRLAESAGVNTARWMGLALVVDYNTSPSNVTPGQTTPSFDTSTNPVRVASLTPTFTGTASDADGGLIAYYLQLFPVTGASPPAANATPSYDSNWQQAVPTGTPMTHVIPQANALVNGQTYAYRMIAGDGQVASKQWSSDATGWKYITVDMDAPAYSQVSSTAPIDTWSATPGGSATFNFNSSSSDVAGYTYGLDEPNPSTYTPGHPGAYTVPAVAEGWHTFYVQPKDRAGNIPIGFSKYSFGVGQAGITSPRTGAAGAASSTSEARFTLTASARASYTKLVWQYKRSDAPGDAWVTIPDADLKTPANATTAQPVTMFGDSGVPTVTTHSTPVVWDAASTVGADGPVQIRAGVMTSGQATPSTFTPPSTVTIDTLHSAAATEQVGPGSLNMLTGDYTLSGSDVSLAGFGSPLTLSRTLTSRNPGASTGGIFGPGWVPSISVEDAGSDYTGLTETKIGATVTQVRAMMPDGSGISFSRNAAGGLTPEVGAEDLQLKLIDSGLNYELTDSDGNRTLFTQTGGLWKAAAVNTATDNTNTVAKVTTTWGAPNGVVIPTKVTSNADGVSCPAADMRPMTSRTTQAERDAIEAARGCRVLYLNYGAGDRVDTVQLAAYDPDTALIKTVTVAQYSYDVTSGRLLQAWDPRLGGQIRSTYTYTPTGRVQSVQSANQPAMTFSYSESTDVPAPLPAKVGRLTSTAQATQLEAGVTKTAKTGIAYDLAVAGGPALPNMTGEQTQRWGQYDTNVPVTATAIIPPQTDNVVPTDLSTATISYLNAQGREVNSASPGGAADRAIDATMYSTRGDVVTSLTAANRQRALDVSPTDSPSTEAGQAFTLSTYNIYSVDGQQLTTSYGPEHFIVSGGARVRARQRTINTYDEPSNLDYGVQVTGQQYNLITTSTTGAYIFGAAGNPDIRTTKTAYNWALRQPTVVTTDPAGLNLQTSTSYDATTGLVTSTTLPAGYGTLNTPATTINTYFTAAANPTYPFCGGRAEWAGQLCRTGPGGQPATGTGRPELPATWNLAYNTYLSPTSVNQASATVPYLSGVLRSYSTGYDAANRPVDSTISAPGTPSVAIPKTRTTYDPASGLVTATQYLDGSDNVTAQITRGYDVNGRLIAYKDADATTPDSPTTPSATTSKFDLQGRPVQSSDGRGTTIRTYDPTRGFLTSLSDSQVLNPSTGAPDPFTATYGPDGALRTTRYPGDLIATRTVDEVGTETDLTYTLASSVCSSNCALLAEHVDENIHEQTVTRDSTLSRQTYGYDAMGRLTSTLDTVGNTCTARAYQFGSSYANAGRNSNRTGYASTSLTNSGTVTCPAIPTSPQASYSYDTADRATDSGYAYDSLGRTVNLPASAAANGTAQAPTYYANDLVATLGNSTYTLDPTGIRHRSITTSGGTRTQHFDGDDDSPTWSTDPTAGGYSRNITGIDGDLAAVRASNGTIAIQLSNLHDDIIATTTLSPASSLLTGTFESTEFGIARSASDIGNRRYGWVGAKVRAADNAAGVILMGVRLYNPATGRFLSVDPVQGGNPNSYIYPPDPVNMFDLDGNWGWKKFKKWAKRAATITGYAAAGACIFATAGACAVVTVAAIAASGAYQASRYKTGETNLRGALTNFGVDAVTARFKGARSTFTAKHTGRSVARHSAKYVARHRGFRATRTLRSSWRHNRYSTLGWGGVQAYYGYRAYKNGW